LIVLLEEEDLFKTPLRPKSPNYKLSDVLRTPEKNPSTITNADLKHYKVGQSWESWSRRFNFVANAGCWSEGVKVATLCHYMPEEIKEFLLSSFPKPCLPREGRS